ncbi:MAG: DUF2384 domain-containing protein [Acidiferrobacteraceae bacterium]|jgi:hypothetical protein
MNPLSQEDRIQLSQLIFEVLEVWRVSPAEQITLLGLPEQTKPRALKRYREGTPLPDELEIWQRVQQLAGIADALRTSFPRNPQYGGIWMHRRNRRFGDRTPLASMLEDGMSGITAVHMHLDCSYDWHVDEKVHADKRS